MMQQLIVGMPNSGKSTYIAALRHLLIANEVHTELELTGLAANEKHLNKLEADWLDCKQVQRTKTATEGWVEFRVKDRKSGTHSTLSIPDLRGEAFEQPACNGLCQKDVYDAVTAADGILLFTNADREDDTLMISEFSDILLEYDKSDPPTPIKPFKTDEMPEEVKIVEFLQVANRRPQRPRRRKIAVIVSAWDVVAEAPAPSTWLEANRPMLAQFLAANADLWNARVYGISAQGGKLPDRKRELAKIKQPSERIRVVGHGAGTHDLSAPLQWLMAPT